jgi:hypothetical protein
LGGEWLRDSEMSGMRRRKGMRMRTEEDCKDKGRENIIIYT